VFHDLVAIILFNDL